MDGYSFYRCDRNSERMAVVEVVLFAMLLRILISSFRRNLKVKLSSLCGCFFRGQRMPRLVSHVVVGIVYFPPNGDCAVTATHKVDCLDKIMQRHPNAGIILCGDFNRLNDRAIISYPLKQLSVQQLGRIMCLIKYTQI